MALPGSITLHWYRRGSALWARLSTRFHNIARRFDLLAVLRSMDPLGADGAGGQPSGSAAGGDGLYNVTEQANSADADMADATGESSARAALMNEAQSWWRDLLTNCPWKVLNLIQLRDLIEKCNTERSAAKANALTLRNAP